MSELTARVNEDNPDPRVACALVLDTSGSMLGAPMDELNAGYAAFVSSLQADKLARKRTEVTVVAVGPTARVVVPFTEGRDLTPTVLEPGGMTPLGGGITIALDELEAQKRAYKATGLEYYRPWLFVISDGAPSDEAAFEVAAARARALEAARGVTVFVVAVGEDAQVDVLGRLSAQRQPLRLAGLDFTGLFTWLSASMSSVASSQAYGPGDGQTPPGQNPLPPPGWATW